MTTVREMLIAGAVRDWAAGRDLETITPPPLAEMVALLAGELTTLTLQRVDYPPEQDEVDDAVLAVIRDDKIATAIRGTAKRNNGGFPDHAEVEEALGQPVRGWDINRVYRDRGMS